VSTADASQLRKRAHEEAPAYLATLQALVEQESPSSDAAAGDALASLLTGILTEHGWEVERHARSEVGDIVLARWPLVGDGPSTLLLAHYDTVWPLGTLAEMPFNRDGDVVRGPGVLDMKAGITTAIHAVRLAADHGPLLGPVTLLVTSDEEIGAKHSQPLIEAEAQRHDRVLVVEPGADEGAYKVGRKGVGDMIVTLTGIPAHAGLEPQVGASALRELAHLVLYAEDLNDYERGTTVNVTVARGGTTGNVIAETATANLDMRVLLEEESGRVEEALHAYQPRDARVKIAWSGGFNRPPLESTTANLALQSVAKEKVAAMGLPWSEAVVGGASDGNFTSAMGIATLDGLGSVGSGAHARHEHIVLSATLDRLAVVASLVVAEPEG